MARSPELLWESAIVIEAPPAEVADQLLRASPGKVGPDNAYLLHSDGRDLTLTGGPDVFLAGAPGIPGGGGMIVEVDRARRTFAVQGGWWYRGEHTVQDDPRGTRVVYRIYNVGQVGWMVSLRWRSFRRTMAAPADQAARLGERLHAKAYVAG